MPAAEPKEAVAAAVPGPMVETTPFNLLPSAWFSARERTLHLQGLHSLIRHGHGTMVQVGACAGQSQAVCGSSTLTQVGTWCTPHSRVSKSCESRCCGAPHFQPIGCKPLNLVGQWQTCAVLRRLFTKVHPSGSHGGADGGLHTQGRPEALQVPPIGLLPSQT